MHLGRLIGRIKGGMNTKLRAVTDASGRALSLLMTAAKSSTTPTRQPYWTISQKRSGCLATWL